jgi:hypothetical protein
MVRMAENADGSTWKPSTRGEQAWKEAMEDVASRNDATRRAGRLQREASERGRDDLLRAAAERRHTKLVNRRTT